MCLQIGYPTLASIPHSVINGYKRVLAVAVETDYSFPLADKVKICFPLENASLPVQAGLQSGRAVLFPLLTEDCFLLSLSARFLNHVPKSSIVFLKHFLF